MHLKTIPFQCKMCDVVCLLFGVEDCSIIVFCHLCVLVCDFIVHYSIFLNVLSPCNGSFVWDPASTIIDTHYK